MSDYLPRPDVGPSFIEVQNAGRFFCPSCEALSAAYICGPSPFKADQIIRLCISCHHVGIEVC